MSSYRYETPFRDVMLIISNAVIVIAVNIFYLAASGSRMYAMLYLTFIGIEVPLSIILLRRAEVATVMKFVVPVLTVIFMVAIVIIYATGQCCYSGKFKWIGVLVGFILFRIIYVVDLYYLGKSSEKYYAKQQLDAKNAAKFFGEDRTSEDYEETFRTSRPAQQIALRGNTCPQPIGFENLANVNQPDATHEKNYGWAV